MGRLRTGLATTIGAGLCLFLLYTTLFGELPPIPQRAIPLALAGVLTVLLLPASRTRPNAAWAIAADAVLAAAAVATGAYVTVEHEAIALRMGDYTTLDAVVSSIGTLLVLELSRRALGWSMTLVALGALVYIVLGGYLPGELGHRGFSFVNTAVYLYLSQEGVFGVTLEAMVSLIFPFMLFGAFLEMSGAGDLMIAAACSLTQRVTGGPALAAVVSSCLFGSISGSAVANVTGTGTYTIPLMKRFGYRPEFAAAVEATASSGGAIMPPVMGAGAFLMAQYLGISYAEIVRRAFVPALLFYIGLGVAVYLRAKRLGLGQMPGEAPAMRLLLRRRGHLLVPLASLLVLLVYGVSPAYAALISWILLVVLAVLIPSDKGRLGLRGVLDGFSRTADQSVPIFAVVAASGILVGAIALTGIGIKFSLLMVAASGQSLLLGLVFAMLGSFILGTGLPPIAAYVLTVVVAGSSLASLGADLFSIHLFCFYFASLAVITPPVAIAAFTAAGLANADPFETGWISTRLGITGMVVPYMFVFGPALLMNGTPLEIAMATVTAVVGAAALAAALEGYLLTDLSTWERVAMAGAALAMIKPGWRTDLAGAVVLLAVWLVQRATARRRSAGLRPAT